MSELLTVNRAAKRLGMGRRRLLRLIQESEQRAKKRWAIRLRGECRTTVQVTWPALRRHLPQLFDGGGLDGLEKRLRGYMRETDRRMEECAEEVCRRVIAPVKRELEERDERVAGMVVEVGERVSELAEKFARHVEHDAAEKLQ